MYSGYSERTVKWEVWKLQISSTKSWFSTTSILENVLKIGLNIPYLLGNLSLKRLIVTKAPSYASKVNSKVNIVFKQELAVASHQYTKPRFLSFSPLPLSRALTVIRFVPTKMWWLWICSKLLENDKSNVPPRTIPHIRSINTLLDCTKFTEQSQFKAIDCY